jgi:hypothetical protein
MTDERSYIPGQIGLDLKQEFAKILRFVQSRNGFVTSVSGADTVSVETLPGSPLPDELRELGYRLQPDGEGERILPAAITEFVLLEGSTVPVVMRHAGITRVERYRFSL